MKLYLDTSALVKIIVPEPESEALRGYLADYPTDTRIASSLARTELVRAAARQGSLEIVAHARSLLTRLDLIALTSRVLDVAATVMPPELRSLDAIHLAAALTAPDLRALVTYDDRLAQAVAGAGITVVTPR